MKYFGRPHNNIPGTFWIDRLDVVGKIVPDKEANVGIAVALTRCDDEVKGNFHPQILVKFKRFEYTSSK